MPTQNDIQFLGICQRADLNSKSNNWNLLGLSFQVTAIVLPLSLGQVFFGFNLRTDTIDKTKKIQIVDENKTIVTDLLVGPDGTRPNDALENLLDYDGKVVLSAQTEWTTIFLPIRGIHLERSGRYSLIDTTEGEEILLGDFWCRTVAAQQFTPSEISAIRSNPHASKVVHVEMGCKECDSSLKTYSALEQSDEMVGKGYIWYKNVDESFDCTCGKVSIDLSPLRNNLHLYLGQSLSRDPQLGLTPLYEKSALESVRTKFVKLLDKKTLEEPLQQFFTENPILFHQFSPKNIIPKPPILTSHVADFGIVSAENDLILIEIEKATTPLMTKTGKQSAYLTHAFGQVTDWLHVISEHRIAVLNELGIESKGINRIRGVAIVGREHGYDAQQLRKLKVSSANDIDLLTFDDVLGSIDSLIAGFGQL